MAPLYTIENRESGQILCVADKNRKRICCPKDKRLPSSIRVFKTYKKVALRERDILNQGYVRGWEIYLAPSEDEGEKSNE